jgi:N-acetylmuramoyl-L-alanine amidase
VGRRYVDGIELGDGLLRGVRIGQYTVETSRVVLDLERYERHRLIELSHPPRVVIDVYGRRPGPQGGDPARPAPGGRAPRTVVLDAGHGGRDPGAIGVGGVREKAVTLKLAKELGPRLEDRGFRVVYTRENDRTLSLEERTAIAEAAGGDLFISLHANASRRRSVKGIETYYPDVDHARHTLRVAARENGVPRSELDDLQKTMAQLRAREVSPRSRRLAELVQAALVQGLPSSYGSVDDLGVKKGPFYVLFLSDMPAILVEVGFVTNRSEAKRLRDDRYLEVVAEHIASGLSRYRSSDATIARTGPR